MIEDQLCSAHHGGQQRQMLIEYHWRRMIDWVMTRLQPTSSQLKIELQKSYEVVWVRKMR